MSNVNTARAVFEAIEYGPERLSSNPHRRLAIAPHFAALQKVLGQILKDYEYAAINYDQFDRLRPKVMGRKHVCIFDDGDLAWRSAVEDLIANVNGHIEPLPPPPLKMLTGHDLVQMEFPPRKRIVDPILPEKGLLLVHAKRGVGKTFFGLSLAYAIATGSAFLDWQVSERRRVCVIDGEMPLFALKERFCKIAKGSGVDLTEAEYIQFLAADFQEFGLPDLTLPEGQTEIQNYIEHADVVLLDNLSTLFRSIRENENSDWVHYNDFVLSLRRQGKAVITIHHSGKSGTQRGGSRKEDIQDTVLSLKQPEGFSAEDGCNFQIIFEKTRGFFGKDAEPFEVKLDNDERAGIITWQKSELSDAIDGEVIELNAQGKSVREIAKILDTSKSTVQRILKRKSMES